MLPIVVIKCLALSYQTDSFIIKKIRQVVVQCQVWVISDRQKTDM
jgi:hypothetical protein